MRCLHALLHGDLRSAVGFNAMTVLLAPVLLAAWLSVGVAAFRGRGSPKLWVAPRWIGLSLAAALGLFWILGTCPWTHSRGWHREPGTRRSRVLRGAQEPMEGVLLGWPYRGCSSMVELQPSKLVVRVRFPSPAPHGRPSADENLGHSGGEHLLR